MFFLHFFSRCIIRSPGVSPTNDTHLRTTQVHDARERKPLGNSAHSTNASHPEGKNCQQVRQVCVCCAMVIQIYQISFFVEKVFRNSPKPHCKSCLRRDWNIMVVYNLYIMSFHGLFYHLFFCVQILAPELAEQKFQRLFPTVPNIMSE